LRIYRKHPNGDVAERFKAHAWKACWGQPLAGSNPVISATNPLILNNFYFSPCAARVAGFRGDGPVDPSVRIEKLGGNFWLFSFEN
tara:strand:- start:2173 stop:2430 length:258 start_codon:yes stop_codon:yes gene_type:complete